MTLFLPFDLIHRPKTPFGSPLHHWSREDLRGTPGDLLSEPRIGARDIPDPANTSWLLRELDTGTRYTGYSPPSMPCIEPWCYRFVDR